MLEENMKLVADRQFCELSLEQQTNDLVFVAQYVSDHGVPFMMSVNLQVTMSLKLVGPDETNGSTYFE